MVIYKFRTVLLRSISAVIICVLWSVASFGTDATQSSAQNKPSLKVTLDMYYGRPNPEYTITDSSEIREVLAMLTANVDATADTLPSTDTKRLYPDHPGYRGIFIEVRGTVPPEPRYFFVYKGVIMRVRGARLHLPQSERLAMGGIDKEKAARISEAGRDAVYVEDKAQAVEKNLAQKALLRDVVVKDKLGKTEKYLDCLLTQ